MSVDQVLSCLADDINPVRFCSLCGSSNPHVLCKECCDGIADEMNQMADTIKDMEPEPMYPYQHPSDKITDQIQDLQPYFF